MRTKGITRGLVASLVSLMLLAPLIPAQSVEGQTDLSYYPTPISENSKTQKNLFLTVMSLAIFVFIFVEGLLLYILFRFRRNRTTPAGEIHRGHTKAEIVWTIIPAVILLFIGVISAQAMEDIDRVPDDVDYTVVVTAFQWGWSFTYPDGTTDTTLAVKAGKKVQLDITSRDVIHAVWIPQLGIKLDAVPGRTNTIWFQADVPGSYILKCAEFCYADPVQSGTGHHSMISVMVVCDPAAAGCQDYGLKAAELDCRGQATCIVEAASGPDRFVPPVVLADVGQSVTWQWTSGFHTVTPLDSALWGGSTGSPLQGPGTTFTHSFTADGSYNYRCTPHSQPGAGGTFTGMVGVVKVGTAAAPTA